VVTAALNAPNAHRVLIFEDDFQLLADYTSGVRLRQISADLDVLSAPWDVFFLGHQPMPCSGWPAMWPPRIVSTRSCWIHAYILNRAGQRILAERSYVDQTRAAGETTLDTWLRQVTRQYAVCPMIAVQSCIGSDNLPSGDGYAQMVEWWTAVHKRHSTVIEIAAFLLVPLLLIILAAIFLLAVFRRAAISSTLVTTSHLPNVI
jgi:hypothetical protein